MVMNTYQPGGRRSTDAAIDAHAAYCARVLASRPVVRLERPDHARGASSRWSAVQWRSAPADGVDWAAVYAGWAVFAAVLTTSVIHALA